MRLPSIRLREPGTGRTWDLGPGAILGRMVTAACRLSDPRVSEAHALLSLRGRALRLLALRGEVEVDGQPEDEIEVAPGQRIRIGGTDLDVLDLTLPEEILAIRVGEAEPQELCAGVYSLVRGQSPELVPWDGDDALARIWSTAEGWCIQCNPGHRETVLPGRRWVIHGVVLEAVAIPINLAGPSSTVGPSRIGLTLLARHTSVHLLRPGRQAVVVDGQPGRVLSELCAMGAPADWTVLGGELWPELRADRDALRRNWDRVMRRLRLKLRENGVREDLVRADGLGNVELVLAVGDRVRDET